MVPRKSTLISYLVFFLVLAAISLLHLAAAFVTFLFACFALHQLNFRNRKWLAVGSFLLLLAALSWVFFLFLKNAIEVLPDIVANSIRGIVKYGLDHDVEVPFADNADNLKDLAVNTVKENLMYLQNFVKIATKEFVFQVVAVVVAIGLFFNPEASLKAGDGTAGLTLYEVFYDGIASRFRSFFHNFVRVMGAQFRISLINTVLTATFVTACALPYAWLVIILTFVCGMLPIIGNILSNILIVGLAFTVSPHLALTALIFLVAIHKLEYFLNSKIIGARIRHPMWLMLLALIAGERLMGIPGIILAPVILCFIKVEMSKYEVGPNGEVTEIAPPL